MYEHWRGAGYHIVRVGDGDGEVPHHLCAGEVTDVGDVLDLSVGPDQCRLAWDQVGGVDPVAGGGVPEGVVRGGVQNRRGRVRDLASRRAGDIRPLAGLIEKRSELWPG